MLLALATVKLKGQAEQQSLIFLINIPHYNADVTHYVTL